VEGKVIVMGLGSDKNSAKRQACICGLREYESGSLDLADLMGGSSEIS
jgi:hypothetical protein